MYSTPLRPRNALNNICSEKTGNAPRRILKQRVAHEDVDDIIMTMIRRDPVRNIPGGQMLIERQLETSMWPSPTSASTQLTVNDSAYDVEKLLTFSDVGSSSMTSLHEQVNDDAMTDASHGHRLIQSYKPNFDSGTRTDMGSNLGSSKDWTIRAWRNRTEKNWYWWYKYNNSNLDYFKNRRATLKIKTKSIQQFISKLRRHSIGHNWKYVSQKELRLLKHPTSAQQSAIRCLI